MTTLDKFVFHEKYVQEVKICYLWVNKYIAV